jgi:hypothetical protein
MQLFVFKLSFVTNTPARNMSPRWGEESFGSRKAINMSLLRSEDVPRRARIVVKKENKKLLT